MSQNPSAERQTRIHQATNVGQLALTVSDLRRSVSFYTDLIGLRVLEEAKDTVTLGVADDAFLVLNELSGASEWPRGGQSHPGLYHFAILVPTRTDLGRWLDHWLRQDMPLPGQGDHFVSEALYLEDPDGHGIEIYRDRPREEWEWQNGQVRMGVDPVDIRGLLEEAQRSADPFTSMPVGTTLGHIHLQVTDIAETARFYHDILGFDIVAQMPSALFMSAGGYHHHIGANVWHSRGARPAPDNSVKLSYYTIELPSSEARQDVLNRLNAAGIEIQSEQDGPVVTDPSGIQIRLRTSGNTP
jgi:catechol 2,3-dioxygenase